MFTGTEDEDFFNPSTSSNLASLFGTSMTIKPDNDVNLSYTAPKQPKAQSYETAKSSPKPNSQSTVVWLKFVNVFKLVDEEHVSKGKCGIAIIGSRALSTYEIIIYKSKEDIIIRSKLKPSLIFNVLSNHFVSFYDDQKQQWAVHFDESDFEGFIKEIESHGAQILPETKPIAESDSLSDTSTTKTKANILSRMAKMGQPILPSVPKAVDTESDDSHEKTATKKLKKRQKHTDDKVNGDQTVNLPISPAEFVIVNGKLLPSSVIQNIPATNSLWNTHLAPVPDPFNIFLAESRTHNCEMRMNMVQLSSKLDKVVEEMAKNKLETHQDDRKFQIVSNNTEMIENLTHKSKEQEATICKKEQQIKELTKKLQNCDDSQMELEASVNNLQQKLGLYEEKLATLTKLNDEERNSNEELKRQLTENGAKQDLFAKKLKQVMNGLYQTMMEAFSDKESTFQAVDIQQIVSKNLKTTTLDIIEEFNSDFSVNTK